MTATKANQTSSAVDTPPRQLTVNPAQIEFLRLPQPKCRCPITGMSRSALNELILPTPRNRNKPPVKSFCLRQRGAKTGIRLVDYQSLRAHIRANAESQGEES